MLKNFDQVSEPRRLILPESDLDFVVNTVASEFKDKISRKIRMLEFRLSTLSRIQKR